MGIPFFTIITATRNAAGSLPRLLESLASQTCRDFELIIQDGSSTDDTVAVAEAWRDRLPAFSIASEPDIGIYDAWNKALPCIGGQWVLFLGADDALADVNVLRRTKERMLTYSPHVLFAAGDLFLCQADGTVVQEFQAQTDEGAAYLPQGITVSHSALFHRCSLFVSFQFDTRFRIAGDYEFLCRAWKMNAQAERLGFCVTRMALGGISSHPRAAFTLRLEYAKAAARHFSRTWTVRRIRELVQGAVIVGLSIVLGSSRACIVLNRLRTLRGLSPYWGSELRHE